jgi:hypothetical protein
LHGAHPKQPFGAIGSGRSGMIKRLLFYWFTYSPQRLQFKFQPSHLALLLRLVCARSTVGNLRTRRRRL